MTVQEILAEGKRLLAKASPSSFIDTPDLDAALLLGKTLRYTREELILRAKEKVCEEDRRFFLELLERRRKGECTAYILGRKEFRGLDFTVNHQVLVPRPDTEILLEAALEYADSFAERAGEKNLSLLDLCTGSGALAVSVKNERPFLDVSASDISPQALETAVRNAGRLFDEGLSRGKPKTVLFIQSDIFRKIPGRYNIIVSNPPYIPSGEIDGLAPEVLGEPRLALDGGADGLDIIKKIIAQAGEHLLPGGVLLLEADPGQMPALRTMLAKRGFSRISVRKDLAGRERVISGEIQ